MNTPNISVVFEVYAKGKIGFGPPDAYVSWDDCSSYPIDRILGEGSPAIQVNGSVCLPNSESDKPTHIVRTIRLQSDGVDGCNTKLVIVCQAM